MKDFFEPKTEPARSIYRAFQVEALKRDGRDFERWREAELDAVYQEAVSQAKKLGMRVVAKKDVEDAENYACGSADYGAKWAYRVVDAMRKAE